MVSWTKQTDSQPTYKQTSSKYALRNVIITIPKVIYYLKLYFKHNILVDSSDWKWLTYERTRTSWSGKHMPVRKIRPPSSSFSVVLIAIFVIHIG